MQTSYLPEMNDVPLAHVLDMSAVVIINQQNPAHNTHTPL